MHNRRKEGEFNVLLFSYMKHDVKSKQLTNGAVTQNSASLSCVCKIGKRVQSLTCDTSRVSCDQPDWARRWDWAHVPSTSLFLVIVRTMTDVNDRKITAAVSNTTQAISCPVLFLGDTMQVHFARGILVWLHYYPFLSFHIQVFLAAEARMGHKTTIWCW